MPLFPQIVYPDDWDAPEVEVRERVVVMGTRVDTSQAASHEAVISQKPRPVTWAQWEAVIRAAAGLTPLLADVIKQFWGLPVRMTLFSASHKAHYWWQGDDFHVSQLMLPGVQAPAADGAGGGDPAVALLRISDSACDSLLGQVLGPRPGKAFSFTQLSPLETTILNEFSRDVLTVLMKNLIKKPKQAKKARMDQVHLAWVLQIEEPEDPLPHRRPLKFKEPREVGKLLISLPIGAIKLDNAPVGPETAPHIQDTFFYHVETEARLYIGSTRVALSDLNQLEPGDLVVFENSSAEQLYLIEPHRELQLPFTPEIRHKQHLLVPVTQDIAMMETQPHLTAARQNLWDNLMIEVDAEFLPIKLPLKQLKQMSEGLVVEMGDLINNEICLKVEGKPLAYGELVIVGDKFGVRIKQVQADDAPAHEPPAAMPAPAAPTAPTAAPVPQAADELPPPPPAMPAPEGEEEAADSLLNDDFDDTFDDEEDW